MKRHHLKFEALTNFEAGAERIDPLAIISMWMMSAAAIIMLVAVFTTTTAGG